MKSAKAKSITKRTGASAPSPDVIETISVSRNLNIYEAQSLKDDLLNLPQKAHVVELDLSQVIEIDTAGLQLLLLVRRESSKQGKTLRIAACSPAVQELIELCGLAELLIDALALPASDTAAA